jgi:ProP effector
MNLPNTPSVPVADPRALLKSLQESFPVFREFKPLAIGIDKQLRAKLPELDRKALRMALGMHTHSTKYLKAIAKGTTRFDLDGNSGVELTESHRQHATESLQERSKKEADRRKAQQELEAVERKREAAERQQQAEERERSEKLEQLAAKFGRGS